MSPKPKPMPSSRPGATTGGRFSRATDDEEEREFDGSRGKSGCRAEGEEEGARASKRAGEPTSDDGEVGGDGQIMPAAREGEKEDAFAEDKRLIRGLRGETEGKAIGGCGVVLSVQNDGTA